MCFLRYQANWSTGVNSMNMLDYARATTDSFGCGSANELIRLTATDTPTLVRVDLLMKRNWLSGCWSAFITYESNMSKLSDKHARRARTLVVVIGLSSERLANRYHTRPYIMHCLQYCQPQYTRNVVSFAYPVFILNITP